MRIQGISEETEEYSEDVAILTGKIADLTKTASNPSGVSIFTDETREHYKSTLDIILDISEVYDELNEKQQAALREALGGKRQGQMIAALIRGADQIRESMELMENSSGNALQELSIYQDSIQFSLNNLQQVLVGIAQSNITQDFLKNIINDVTRLLEVIERSEATLRPLFSIIEGITSLVASFSEQLGALGTIITAISLKNAVKGTGRDRMSSLIEYARCDVVVTLNELCLIA